MQYSLQNLLLKQPVLLTNGEELTVTDVTCLFNNYFYNLKDFNITLSNKKVYNLYTSFTKNFITFKNNKINNILNSIIEDQNTKLKQQEQLSNLSSQFVITNRKNELNINNTINKVAADIKAEEEKKKKEEAEKKKQENSTSETLN